MTSGMRYEVDGHVGVITLDRPEARNALTRELYAELERTVREATVRCLVITGADPAFCAGDDVKQILSKTGDIVEASATKAPALTPTADALLHTDIPIVAAVNGVAVGWGMELALMADIRVVSERARFGELFVKRGLCSDVPGLGRLAQLVGREAAAELLFTGRIVDAEEARQLRLASRVVPHDELLPTAMALAHQIADNPPLAVARLKAGLRQALDPDWHALGSWVTASLLELFGTDDHREGVAAFMERRDPVYRGR